MIIAAQINLKQLDKLACKPVTNQKGEKALYCDVILIPCSKGKNHYVIKQATSLEKKKKDPDFQYPLCGKANERGQGAKPPMDGKPSHSAPQATADDEDIF